MCQREDECVENCGARYKLTYVYDESKPRAGTKTHYEKGDVINATRFSRTSQVGRWLEQVDLCCQRRSRVFHQGVFCLRPIQPKARLVAPRSRTKRQQCALFEEHHKSLMKALRSNCSAGGNLIVTKDFFRFGAKYSKLLTSRRCVITHLGYGCFAFGKRILIRNSGT